MNRNYLHSGLTGKTLSAFYQVYNTLGYGFLEKVYENALMLEIDKRGISVVQQQPIKVFPSLTNCVEFKNDLL